MADQNNIIGIGIDITEVKRLKLAMEKWGKTFSQRIFTTTELTYAKSKVSFYQHLAGKFAAKEAIFTALGIPGIGFKDIEITNDQEGKPHARVASKKAAGIIINISISHVKNYAVANAIATKKS